MNVCVWVSSMAKEELSRFFCHPKTTVNSFALHTTLCAYSLYGFLLMCKYCLCTLAYVNNAHELKQAVTQMRMACKLNTHSSESSHTDV
jgi:hypothetical protein